MIALFLLNFALLMVQKTRATFSTNQIENLPVYQSWLVTRVFPRFMQFACCYWEF